MFGRWAPRFQRLSAFQNICDYKLSLTLPAASSSHNFTQMHHRIRCNFSNLIQMSSAINSLSRNYAKHPTTVIGSQPLTAEKAADLIANLKDSEREAIQIALDKYDACKTKELLEGKLAASQWRTRFGRPSKLPALGDVDPTGAFCAFPEDWLKRKAAEIVKPPTSSDLRKIFAVNAVPFVGFGFLDNFVMIIAGEYIEFSLGTFMCISTMAAAGLGNTFSDIIGIGTATYVERGCALLGLRQPDLTPTQMEMPKSRHSANFGRMVGITIGCLLGMSPLMFMDNPDGVEKDVPAACAAYQAKETKARA